MRSRTATSTTPNIGKLFIIGEDIAERPEHKMRDMNERPIFKTPFPAEMKAFCVRRVPEDRTLMENVDLAMRGVGETVGGSM